MTSYGYRFRSRAFTLIELLVVIAIIALLIGILLPAIGSARNTAQDLKCLAQVRGTGISMVLYANDNRDWFPIIPASQPDPRFLANQETAGGLAGLWSTFQVGDGEGSIDPPSISGDVGFVGNFSQGPGLYFDGNGTPLMSTYADALETLVCPRDKEDYYFGRQLTVNSRIDEDQFKVPEPPGDSRDVIHYNLSYLYIAGLKTDDPTVLYPPPLFGDETIAADISTNAWFGWDWLNNQPNSGGEPDPEGRYGFNPRTGYSDRDNHGDAGGNFVFADGSARFVDENPQRVFFSNKQDIEDAGSDLEVGARSINIIKRDRSNKVEVID